MNVQSLSAFWANIYVGLKEKPNFNQGYDDGPWPLFHNIHEVEQVCQKFCNDKGFCVSVTQTKFIYTHGNEPGAIVGIISYPRFPTNNGDLRQKALELAELLQNACGQHKVSIMMPSEVVMLEADRKDYVSQQPPFVNEEGLEAKFQHQECPDCHVGGGRCCTNDSSK